MIEQLQAYLQQDPFKLPNSVHLAVTMLFSMTGVLAGMRRGYDAVGVFALALVVGAGGGLIRDGLFLQQGPPVMTQDWRLLPAVAVACVIGWFVDHWIGRFEKVIALLDAVGLSVYSMVGLIQSIEAGLSVPAAILVGIVNAAGGGLLRDVLTREEPLFFKPGQFYVLASLAGCLIFVLLGYRAVVTPRYAVLIAAATTFLLRTLAITFNWRTAPVQPRVASSNSSADASTSSRPAPGDPQKPS